MKSFQMKALALATLSLGGLVMAGSAFAACPTPTFSGSNVTLAPWSGGILSPAATATLAVTQPGLASTSCKLSLALGSNGAASPAPGNARAFVTYTGDTSDEPRFRARFYVSTANVTNMSAANIQTPVFTYSTTNSPAGLSALDFGVTLAGGATPRLNFSAQDASGVFKQSGNIVLPSFGTYVVEIDMTRGSDPACASGNNVRYWVTDTGGIIVAGTPMNAGVAADDTHPAGTFCVNNGGWTGAPSVALGLLSGSSSKFKQVANTNSDSSAFQLHLDEYDSRRQTYIGK